MSPYQIAFMQISLPILMMLTVFACNKNTGNDSATVRGKLVHNSCASAVVQVLDEKYYNLGQDQWQQSPDKSMISHVFSVANKCSMPAGLKEQEEFTYKVLKSDPTMKNCAV